MNRIYYLLPDGENNIKKFSHEKKRKIRFSLVEHVYSQLIAGLLASAFCAAIIYFNLYNQKFNHAHLNIWAGYFFVITLLRLTAVVFYKLDKRAEARAYFWSYICIIGALLGGTSWGALGMFFFAGANAPVQALMILMVAGVSAGSIPLSAAIPFSAILFLISSVVPFIITIATSENQTYYLFNFALFVYLVYSIFLSFKIYQLIKNSIVLRFENDLLVHNLEISNKKLEHAATHDPLTHGSNRRLFLDNLEKSLETAKQDKTITALFYLDLDHFKAANDKYGHHAGDVVLITVIERLKKFFRQEDMVARVGGDEFAIIVNNVKNRQQLEAIAKKICNLVALPIAIDHNTELHVTASVGISLYPYDGTQEEDLLQKSDQYMYMAKEQGGNDYHFNEDVKEL